MEEQKKRTAREIIENYDGTGSADHGSMWNPYP